MRKAFFAAASVVALTFVGARADVGPDGLHSESWFKESFLDLPADLKEADEAGKRLVVIIEQSGCVYCRKVHEEVLSDPWVSNYIRENFDVVQLNMFGDRPVTDFDGVELPEKEIVQRWGIIFTPTVVFFPAFSANSSKQSGAELSIAQMPGLFGKLTFRDMFEWIASDAYRHEPNFQRFHIKKLADYRASGLLD